MITFVAVLFFSISRVSFSMYTEAHLANLKFHAVRPKFGGGFWTCKLDCHNFQTFCCPSNMAACLKKDKKQQHSLIKIETIFADKSTMVTEASELQSHLSC